MTAYTPGPWVMKQNGPMVWVESSRHTVCSFYRQGAGFAPSVSMDSEANARLIAAAPDLLEALKAVVAIADRKTDEFDRARAAIAKATAPGALATPPLNYNEFDGAPPQSGEPT
jgi:hypothetical protein